MDLTFLGATDTVTGSKYLLRHAGRALLVDCGLFQGYKPLRERNWAQLPVEPASIDAVILTHAHIDHSGWLPLLARNGFRGPVYCTSATQELCRILLADSGHLQEEEAEYLGRHQLSKHKPPLPLYTRDDALRCMKLFTPVAFGKRFEPVAGLHAELAPSGHMPGSSFVTLDSGTRSILFSGDIGRPVDLVMKPPVAMPGADFLVVESTYGDRQHDRADPFAQLADVVNRTAHRNGAVIIPAFAVGRAQALLHALVHLKARGTIPDIPLILNSPMAASATEVYRRHVDELRLSREDIDNLARHVRVVQTPEESRALNESVGPMVIVAGSGMATGGRVVHHLKAFAPHARNTILLAGFQSGGTRGAALANGAPTIRIFGEDVPVRAEVAKLGTMSAHADAQEIIDWLRHFKHAPQRTFITHGEPQAADALRLRVERELGWETHLPYYLENVQL